MPNYQENRDFRNAAQDAGIKGRDHRGNEAIEDFSEYYHNHWDKWDRERDGYSGIKEKARNWWSSKRHRYA